MTAPKPSKTHIGKSSTASRNDDAGLWLRSISVGGRGQAAGIPDLDLLFKTAEEGRRFLRLHVRPQGAARRNGRGAGLFALQPLQQIVEDRLAIYEKRILHPVFLRHVGNRDRRPCLCAAGRRHPAFATALRRHRNAGFAHAFRFRDRHGGVFRRRRSRCRAQGGGRRGGEGPRVDHPGGDAVQSDQQRHRHRPDARSRRRAWAKPGPPVRW